MKDLHDAILNLPSTPDKTAGANFVLAYKIGHRDARHAAAELVVAAPEQEPANTCQNCGMQCEWCETPQAQPAATGRTDGLSQDYNGKLGTWFADQPGARQQLREDVQPAADLSKADLLRMWQEAGMRAYKEDDGEAHEFFYQAVLEAQKARVK